MLTVPRYQTKWGSRAFAVAAPSTWNSLPVNFRTASTVTLFEKMLKTSLFASSPPPSSSEIRRPVEDLSFDSRHWADFDLDSAPLSMYLRGFRRYKSYRIDWLIHFIGLSVNLNGKERHYCYILVFHVKNGTHHIPKTDILKKSRLR